MLLDPAIARAIQTSIAVLFAAATWHKLRDWPRIGGVISGYRLLPQGASLPVAAVLIGFELVVAAGSLVSRQVLFAAAALLLGYAFAIGLNILRGNDRIDCGCTGYSTAAPRLKWAMCLRNGGIALIGGMVASAPVSARPLIWMDFITIACGLAGGAALYAAFEANMAVSPAGANA
jgi:hypothetical protein